MAPKPGGVGQYFGPSKHMVEVHASTCAHCQNITEFASMRQMQEHVDICRACMRLICLQCVGKPCRPWERRMEQQEARYRMLKDMGLA